MIARKYYPTRFGRVRVFVTIADSLLAVAEEPLPLTVREKGGFGPFQLHWPARACQVQTGRCGLHELDAWRKGRCPNYQVCGLRHDNVVVSRRQKLVDSMIVADTIHAATTEDWVAVVSNDDDMVPGVLTASAHSRKIALLRFGRRQPSPYDAILASRKLLPLE